VATVVVVIDIFGIADVTVVAMLVFSIRAGGDVMGKLD
jgi:hypothetical protein